MNLNTLNYYLAVCEKRSFTKAAEDLYISQPTLSRAIAALEEEIGETLIIRGKRSLELTQAGEVCLQEAKEILHRCDALPEYVRKNSHAMHGKLTIGYVSQMNSSRFWSLTRQFCNRYPQVSVHLTDKPNVLTLHQMLRTGQLDALFTSSVDNTFKSESYGEQFLFNNRLGVIMNNAHPLLKESRKTVSIRELKEESFVLFNRSVYPETFDTEISLCRENGFSPKTVDYVDSVKSLILAVSSNKGIGFLTEQFYGFMSDEVTFLPLEENISFNISLLWKTDNRSPELNAYIVMSQNMKWN